MIYQILIDAFGRLAVKTLFMRLLVIFLLFLVLGREANGQLPAADRELLIEAIGKALVKGYLHSGPALKMSTFISEQLKTGRYDTITEPEVCVDQFLKICVH